MPTKTTKTSDSHVFLPMMPTETALKTGAAFREAVSYTKDPPIPKRMTGKQARARYISAPPAPLNLEKIQRVEKEEARLRRNKDMADKKDEARRKRKQNRDAKDLLPKYHKVEEGQILLTEALKMQVTKAVGHSAKKERAAGTVRRALAEADKNVLRKSTGKESSIEHHDADPTLRVSEKRKRNDEDGENDTAGDEKPGKRCKIAKEVKRYKKSGSMRPGALDRFLLPKVA